MTFRCVVDEHSDARLCTPDFWLCLTITRWRLTSRRAPRAVVLVRVVAVRLSRRTAQSIKAPAIPMRCLQSGSANDVAMRRCQNDLRLQGRLSIRKGKVNE